MYSINNRKEDASMKRYAFTTNQFTVITVTVDENNEIVKLCHFMPRSKTIVRMTNPKILEPNGSFGEGPFKKFNLEEWMNGGEFRLSWEDLFRYDIRPTHIPVCQECGIWPVYEHIGCWTDKNGGYGWFSQGLNKKCYLCEGLEEEPMPWVTQRMTLGESLLKAVLEAVVYTSEEIDGLDIEDKWQEEISNLPENWDITDIIGEK